MSGPLRQNRPSLRHPVHDYTEAGRYFVTICTFRRALTLQLPGIAQVVHDAWESIPLHFPDVILDAFVVMPNHVHGIVVITSPGPARRGQHAGHLPSMAPASLSIIIRSFKSAVTRELRIRDLWDGSPFWQANFHDRVIRDDAELQRIRRYIDNNPAMWEHDLENPRRLKNPSYNEEWSWLEAPSP